MTASTRDRRVGAARDSDLDQQPLHRVSAMLERLESPVATYYLLLGACALLVSIGLVMVLSASSVESYQQSGSSYTTFLGQLRFAVLGVVAAAVVSRVPPRWWRIAAPWLLLIAIGLQGLVFSPLGVSVLGNRNWIELGGQRLQPSEFGKLALVIFGATVLAKKRPLLGRFFHALVPLVIPAGAILIGLVLLGHDLGTGLVLLAILGGMLFASGVPARVFLVSGAGVAALAAALVMTSGNRMSRVSDWLSGCNDVTKCFQTVHGKYALADGGWWGVGLGASREKWQWLPEAHNDFIFAIIGEELGLPGTFIVIGLFAVLAFACYRLVLRTEDLFVRVAASGIMVWIVIQAIINIGSVIGLLPVIGVPLPLVSSGGSALMSTLVALGLLLSFARNEPGAKEALAARPGPVRRSLAVLPRRSGRG